MASSRPITECQISGDKNLESILFVGYLPPVNTMPVIGSVPVEEQAFPLELLWCRKSSLVQIGLEVDAEVLFPPSYPYRSGSTRILRENFADLGKEANELLGLSSKDLVVDIGSNDGTLLSNFKKEGQRVHGIEPTEASVTANQNGIKTLMAFFNQQSVDKVTADEGKAKVVTAANVFAHIANVHDVVKNIIRLLTDDGVFISESHYLHRLLETVQYDTIYHEHLRYYSLHSLKYLFELNGLEIFHAKEIPTHGGSIRVYTARKGQRPVQPSVAQVLKMEADAGLLDGSAFTRFRQRVIQSKVNLYAILADIKAKGHRVYGIGAPSRASTLIKYVGLDDGLLDCVLEIKSSPKVGKYMPGTRIPVLDEEKLFKDQPEYALLLSWHITDELRENLRKKGFRGRFISPLPTPRVLD